MTTLPRILVAAGMMLLGASANAQTNTQADVQAYPNKPITIIVPFGPGSATDTIARIIGQHLGSALKETIVIENKPGANGAIAAAYVARAPGDGYTLFLSTNSPHSAAPTLNKTVAYDPVKDFTPISRVGSYTLMLVLNPAVPAKSIPELIAYAKANPGKLSFGSGNTSGVVAGETLKSWAGINIVHVPYRSAPPAINDVLGGRVSMMFTDLTTGLPHVKANALRALAVTRLQRSKLVPDLPTLNEAGVANFDMDSWAGMFAPAGTPPAIVTRLNGELRRIIDNPEINGKIGAMGFEAFSSSPEELGDFVKVQLAKWTKMIKDAGIQPE
ncbi:MAG: tripartite tricarboxylate transporter substrate binding protein [Xanthobacteraceae bacterium]